MFDVFWKWGDNHVLSKFHTFFQKTVENCFLYFLDNANHAFPISWYLAFCVN